MVLVTVGQTVIRCQQQKRTTKSLVFHSIATSWMFACAPQSSWLCPVGIILLPFSAVVERRRDLHRHARALLSRSNRNLNENFMFWLAGRQLPDVNAWKVPLCSSLISLLQIEKKLCCVNGESFARTSQALWPIHERTQHRQMLLTARLVVAGKPVSRVYQSAF